MILQIGNCLRGNFKVSSEIILKGRLNGSQRNKLKGLFDMFYSPAELASEIGINKNQIYYVYVPLGCPVERGKHNHIYINGKLFAEWYIKFYPKVYLNEDETFCKTCKKAVKIYLPKNRTKDNLSYVLSTCPVCGRTLTKIIDFKRS